MPSINLGKVVAEYDNIKIVDIGSSEFDPASFDFSQFKPGDIIFVFSDMGASS